jgi:hypothetical protein
MPEPTVAPAEITSHYPIHQPESPQADWKDFAERTAEPRRDHAPVARTVDLTNRSPEEREFMKKVGDKVEPKAEAKTKEATNEKADVKPEEVDAKQSAKAETAETKQTGKPESEQGQPQGRPEQIARDKILERAAAEPEYEQIVDRLYEPTFPDSAEGYARYQVLGYALNQVINTEDVLFFLAKPANASVLKNMQTAAPHDIAKAVHKISAELRFGSRTKKSSEEPRPRAPKPPAEVGGRGAQPDDAARVAAQNGDFKAFSAEMDRRARNSR